MHLNKALVLFWAPNSPFFFILLALSKPWELFDCKSHRGHPSSLTSTYSCYSLSDCEIIDTADCIVRVVALENVCTEPLKVFSLEDLHLGVQVHFPRAIVVDRLCCWNDLYCSAWKAPAFAKSWDRSCRAGCWGRFCSGSAKPLQGTKEYFLTGKKTSLGGEDIPYDSWGFLGFLFICNSWVRKTVFWNFLRLSGSTLLSSLYFRSGLYQHSFCWLSIQGPHCLNFRFHILFPRSRMIQRSARHKQHSFWRGCFHVVHDKSILKAKWDPPSLCRPLRSEMIYHQCLSLLPKIKVW